MSRSDSSHDEAAQKLAQLFPPAAVDALLADAEASGTPIDGPEGLMAQITKSVLERALDVEIADHLGYEHGDPAGYGSGNSRNGHGRKTVLTPRARSIWKCLGTATAPFFDPVIVPKRQRRLGSVEDMILSLYARGMSTRDITEHLAEVYGASVSAATISRSHRCRGRVDRGLAIPSGRSGVSDPVYRRDPDQAPRFWGGRQ